MNKFRLATLSLLLLALLAAPASALGASAASPIYDDVVIFGEDYALASGETVEGNVMVFGGDVAERRARTGARQWT